MKDKIQKLAIKKWITQQRPLVCDLKKKESKRNQEEVYTKETDMETTWGQYLEWF